MARGKLKLPLIVEGRYDKSAILGMLDGIVITTDGFAVFNNTERVALIRRLSAGGIILLTDSDGGGQQIRSFISGIIPPERLIHLYIPEISGKEPRKRQGSKAGTLGVEGVGGEILLSVLDKYIDYGQGGGGCAPAIPITMNDMFVLGLSGGKGAEARRDRLAENTGLVHGMRAKTMLRALNFIMSAEELYAKMQELGD